MIDTPQIVQAVPQQVAIIRFTIPREQMPQIMGPAVQELLGAISAQEAGPAGALFSHHLRAPGATFDFELGFPVTRPIAPAGRVQPGLLPAGTVARTVYRGGYEGLGGAWGEFMRWIESNGHKPAATLWERYLSGPESSQDPAQWQTELNRPLLGAG